MHFLKVLIASDEDDQWSDWVVGPTAWSADREASLPATFTSRQTDTAGNQQQTQ